MNTDRDKLPFDFSGFRCMYYTDSIQGKSLVERKLYEYLTQLAPGGVCLTRWNPFRAHEPGHGEYLLPVVLDHGL